jgi:superfamily II DNA or RNA helicase
MLELKRLSVSSTGARKGDVLIGTHSGTRGSIMKIINKNVSPSKNILDRMRCIDDIWQQFLVKLGGIEHFTDMSINEREQWLSNNQNYNDFFGEEDHLQLLQPGIGDSITKQGSIFVSYLPDDVLNNLVSAEYLVPSQINNTVIEYTGKTSTLVILKTFWKISTSYKLVNNFPIVIDVGEGKLYDNLDSGGKEIIVVGNISKEYKKIKKNWEIVKKQEIGFRVVKERINLSLLDNTHTLLQKCTKGFTAASYKSLLQKLIRYMPISVDMGHKVLLPGDEVLRWTLLTLLKHPGSFVPNIQRFVSGLESTAKRLAISIYEDSSVEEKDYDRLLSLLSGGLLAQRVKEWKPSRELINNWIDVAIGAYNNPVSLTVNYKEEAISKPFHIQNNQSVLETSSCLLDELRSFPSDLGLARGWFKEGRKRMTTSTLRPEVMPFHHCVDQHWIPAIAYYFNPEVVRSTEEDIKVSSQPFASLFFKIFFEVSGINPRKCGYSKDFEEISFVKETRKAQKLILCSLQEEKIERYEKTGEIYTFEYEIPSSWLSGLVGVMKINVKDAHTIVTLRTDDPLQLVVAREPRVRRGKTSYKQLTAKQEEEAIKIAKKRLINGVKLNQASIPHKSLKGSKVYLIEEDDDEYYAIEKEGEDDLIEWDLARYVKIDLPIHTDLKRTFRKAILTYGNGVEANFYEKIDSLLSDIDTKILQRLLIYISTANSKFEMNRIGRDGGSTGMSVNINDVEVYQLLLRLTTIIPAALRPDVNIPAAFTVPNGPLLWKVRKYIQDKMSNNISKEDIKGWSTSRFSDISRKPYDYQITTKNDMIQNHKNGLRGNFMWLNLGSGKTFIILSYLAYLRDQNKLPKYVIYTLPPESAMSIVEEIKYFDIKTNVLIPLKNIDKKREMFRNSGVSITQGCKPKKYHINLIFHDHLKNCKDDLPQYIGDSVVIFDEVHLFLNQTLRTGMGMNLSHLSREFISLTGTPIVDNKTEKLIAWLEQIVPFEVNKKNFWVAANNMISKEVTTGIKTETNKILSPFNDIEQKEYQKLVPPGLGGTNTNPHSRDWMRAADICYKACDRGFVKLSLQMISNGRGVMIVVRNTAHQERMKKLLMDNSNLGENDIFLISKDKSIFLTDDTVKSGKTHDYKVVIVPKNKAQGYTLTRLSVMLTSVYPSNSATRDQLRGRINRIGQKEDTLLYKILHIGILTSILENHDKARNLLQALQAVAKSV